MPLKEQQLTAEHFQCLMILKAGCFDPPGRMLKGIIMKKIILALIILAVSEGALTAEGNVLYFNNIARPMAMGGAYAGVQDSLLAHLYNPAAVDFASGRKMEFHISLDLIRALYIFILLSDSVDYDVDDDALYGMILVSAMFSTANISVANDRWFFKLNFLDQLITQGPDFPMYSSSATIAYKFKGPLTGFQTGVTGHIYNIGSTSLPQGYSITWGLFYRPADRSPFSFGLYYFHASDDMPYIRKPFEQVLNNTFNAGVTYELVENLTLSFDLRNINNFNRDAYLQPHLGIEKVFVLATKGQQYLTLALRAGTYWDSETEEVGYSGGFDVRYNFTEGRMQSNFRMPNKPGYIYCSYSFTKEDDVPALNKTLKINHIISIGVSL